MAKSQNTSFVDAHIEKVVLLVCLLVVAFAAVKFGLSTSKELTVVDRRGKEKLVPPSEVDKSLLDAAKQIDKQIQNRKVEPVIISDDPAVLAQRIENPLPKPSVRFDYGEPMAVGLVSTKGGGEAKAPVTLEQIAKVMPKPAKPANWYGIELTSTTVDKDEPVELKEGPTWRAVTYYPWNELNQAWEGVLKHTIIVPQLIVMGCEMQIQELQSDGQWETIETIKPVRLPDPETGEPVAFPGLPEFVVDENGQGNAQEVRKAIGEYNQWIIELLQPEYYDIWVQAGQTSWRQHMPLDEINKWFPKAEKAEDEKADKPAAAARKRVKPTNRNRRMQPDMMMPPMGPAGAPMPTGRGAGRVAARRSTAAGDEQAQWPGMDSQLAAGKAMAWFHLNSIKFGKKYRCRIRWVFVNPLLTYPQNVHEDHKADASVQQVASPWSPWSDPVAVYRKMDFFITGANVSSKELNVTIFTKVLSQLVMAKFGRIQVGQTIGGTAEVELTNPVTRELEKQTIDFDTGAVAVDFNFAKRIITRAGLAKNDAVEMIYLDAQGNLRSKIMYTDLKSPEYRDLMKEYDDNRPEGSKPTAAERRKLLLEEKRKAKEKRRRTPTKPTDTPPGIGPGGPGMPPMPPARSR